MTMHEQDIIQLFADMEQPKRADVILGIGDDAAVMQVPAQHQLVTSCDTLNLDVHFPDCCPPDALGYRSLAVNVSDLAACGAAPAWVQLALTLPKNDVAWLQAYVAGFAEGLQESGCCLVGGDITRGPLAMTVQVMGFVPEGQSITRAGARAGDVILVAGELGASALALQHLLASNNPEDPRAQAWLQPRAQWRLGMALRGLATSAVDLSDGLATDLGHICTASNLGAVVRLDALPIASQVTNTCDVAESLRLALTGGEDYLLCFTAPAAKVAAVLALAKSMNQSMTVIGEMITGAGITWLDAAGQAVTMSVQGYQHF